MAIRLSGLTSGMDTDAIVQELVSAYSKKTEKYEKASTKLTWKQDAWKTLNTKIYDLYTKTSNMRFSSSYNLRKTAVSDATKATVTASSNAVTGTQKLKINSTAQSSYMTGAYLGENITGDTTLEDLGYKGNYTKIKLKSAETGEVTEIGVKKDMKISEVLTKLKDAGLNASLDTNNGRIFVNAKTSGAKSDFTLYGDSVSALDALDALGLNTALIEYDEKLGKNVFTDAAGSFAEYYKYYTEALGETPLELKAPTMPEETTMPTPPEQPGENATEEQIEDYNEALSIYQEKLDAYLSWSVYRENLTKYDQYKKDHILATSTSYADYVTKMAEKGYINPPTNEPTAAEYYQYAEQALQVSRDEYNNKRNEAIDDVLLYQMKGNYAQYKAAFRENSTLQVACSTLENQNKAWANQLKLLENKEAAKESLDKIMVKVGENSNFSEYDAKEISNMVKELRNIDIYETDKDGKKTSKFTTGALDAIKRAGCADEDAEELLELFDNMSEDVENVENYVKTYDDITSVNLDDVKSRITEVQGKIDANNTTLTGYQVTMKTNQEFIDANAEMKDINVLNEDNTVNTAKLETALMEFVEKAKKANEIYNDTTGKYDGTKDCAFKIKGSNAEIELNGVKYMSESFDYDNKKHQSLKELLY